MTYKVTARKRERCPVAFHRLKGTDPSSHAVSPCRLLAEYVLQVAEGPSWCHWRSPRPRQSTGAGPSQGGSVHLSISLTQLRQRPPIRCE